MHNILYLTKKTTKEQCLIILAINLAILDLVSICVHLPPEVAILSRTGQCSHSLCQRVDKSVIWWSDIPTGVRQIECFITYVYNS